MSNKAELKEVATLIRDYLMLQKRISQIELGWKPTKKTEKGSIIVDEAVLDEIIKECSK